MEEHYTVSPRDSEFVINEQNAGKEPDPLAPNHPIWSTRRKCVMAYICFVMSYTNVLRFCMSIEQYNIIMIIPYVFFIIFVGVPALVVEIMLGRFVTGNIRLAWKMCPPASGIFWCLFMITAYLITLNHSVNHFLLKYLFSSLRGLLMWGSCDEPWSGVNCYKIGEKSKAIDECLKTHSEDFCHNLTWESSGAQFWANCLEDKRNFAEICLSIFCLLFSVAIVGLILCKKTRSFEKVLELLIYPSVVLWIIFLFVSFSTWNAFKGFKKLCRLKWNELIKPRIWVKALEDTIYLTGSGNLSISFISTHGKFTDNIFYDVVVVIFGSFSACFLLGFPILNVVMANRHTDDLDTDESLFKDIPEIFISLSEALLHYPYPKTLWAFMYYLGCFLASVSSQTILVMSFCDSIQGILNKNSDKAYNVTIAIVSVVFFLLAVGFSFFQHTRDLNHVTMPVVCLLLCTVTWQLFYGVQKFNYDFHFMMGYPLPTYIKITWITLPLMTFTGLLVKISLRIREQPVKDSGIIYVGIIVSIYIFVIAFRIVEFRLRKEKISKVLMANPNWGPENPLLKKSRVVFDTSTVNREFMYRQELYKKPAVNPPNFSDQNIVQLI